jgi:hypothetical protein
MESRRPKTIRKVTVTPSAKSKNTEKTIDGGTIDGANASSNASSSKTIENSNPEPVKAAPSEAPAAISAENKAETSTQDHKNASDLIALGISFNDINWEFVWTRYFWTVPFLDKFVIVLKWFGVVGACIFFYFGKINMIIQTYSLMTTKSKSGGVSIWAILYTVWIGLMTIDFSFWTYRSMKIISQST